MPDVFYQGCPALAADTTANTRGCFVVVIEIVSFWVIDCKEVIVSLCFKTNCDFSQFFCSEKKIDSHDNSRMSVYKSPVSACVMM